LKIPKGATRNRKLKRDRQHNEQKNKEKRIKRKEKREKNKEKRTNNDPQNTTHKQKQVTRTPLKLGVNSDAPAV